MERCDECGFDYGEIDTTEVAGSLRSLCGKYVEVLRDPREEDLRTRPALDVWSVIEYTCHVRDVLLIQRDRVILALVEDTPSFARMYRDERVVLAGYRRESSADVRDELGFATGLFAKLFEGISADQRTRRCIYNFPVATETDVGWLGRHVVHEASHHLLDVMSVLARVRG